VAEVLGAIDDADWQRFKELVHPYVHWTEGGVTVRGRTRVIEQLAGRPSPPTSYELRDGQVYRWTTS
jgi:hypothetical protein